MREDQISQIQDDGVQIKIGQEIKLKKKERIDEILGIDDKGTYVASRDGDKITISLFDHDLNLVKSNQVELKFGSQKLKDPILEKRGSDFVMFTDYKDKKKEMTYSYIQTLNKSSLTFSSPKIVEQISYKGFKKSESGNATVDVCEDGTYLLVESIPAKHKKEDYFFDIKVLDVDMEEVWLMEGIKATYGDKKIEKIKLYDEQFTNKGNYYRLVKHIDKTRKYKKGEIDYTFEMEVYKATQNEPLSFELGLDDNFITDINFEELDNGGLQFVGFYSHKGFGQNGSFSIIVDENYEVVSTSIKEFPVDFIVQHSSKKAKKKAKKKEAKGKEIQLSSYVLDDIIENNDGSVTLVAEEYYTYTTTTTSSDGSTSTTTHYVYGNIILVKYNSEGNVEWMELIPKRQHGVIGGYNSGYALMKLKNGNLVLVFNDNPKNSFYEETGKFYTWKAAYKNAKYTDVVYYEITDEGKMSRHLIYKGDEEEVISRPFVSVEVAPNEMVILAQSKKTTKFVKLIFD